ncbi:MAG: nicotinate-nucleotide adenylyltransferase [Gammaproteobacteria bacterium]|nr:MAG: nicotinate-nucleotide adenylyltransferase [Gammaproteobacteria bacterium]
MLGILGGTFDPVHFGHLRPALDIQQVLGLEEVRLIPCHIPPHRPQPVADAPLRVAMLEAAIRNYPEFRIDRRELERDGPSWTFDTLMSLRAELGTVSLSLLIGLDAFHDLPTWHRWHELINLCHMVVMTRPGSEIHPEGELEDFVNRHRVMDPAELEKHAVGRVLFQNVTQLEISATRIRTLLAHGENAGFLVPEAVLEIIRREHLYQARTLQ